ncbi:MAG: nuclear transport factor 2 family protein [Spirulina sp. DLM2.Bin59]|nr:MAG: nuclear transport factor 2 family protein [Spirulina sp. DLM2.Bin59]
MGNFAFKRLVLSGLFTVGLLTSIPRLSHAQNPQTIPPELQNTLSQLEAAANRQDLDAVMQFYSPTFTTSDNLAASALAQGLEGLWREYNGLRYDIQVKDWQMEGDELIAETLTQISGTRFEGQQRVRLRSEVRSRQRINPQTQQIKSQEILTERTLIFMGDRPPNVDINLPEQVQAGQTFDFDVIVQEPLNGDLLMGGVLEESVAPTYLSRQIFDLELLQAGGLFKRGRIDPNAGDQWFSAVLIRGDGMTMVTQRVRVED